MRAVKRIAIVAKRKSVRARTGQTVKRFGYQVVNKKPDLVLSIGGDGTYLHAERVFPGVPKLLIRDSRICLKCNDESLRVLLNAYKAGAFRKQGWTKIEGRVEKREKHRLAANDIVLRNREQTQAIRFTVKVDGKELGEERMGDGVVISTPFGSEAYYKTITGRGFRKGLGIAFNNVMGRPRGMVVGENARIVVTLNRGKALVSFDNDKKLVPMHQGDKLVVRKSREKACLLRLA